VVAAVMIFGTSFGVAVGAIAALTFIFTLIRRSF